MHWNLPSNPVDLEQREGRVHRYKGHAVRKNVARDYAGNGSHAAQALDADPWRQLFDVGAGRRPAEQSDLVPFWVYPTDGGAHIERHLPMIPLSKDVDRAEVLRRSLAVYRMAFGQPAGRPRLVPAALPDAQPISAAAAELRIDLTPALSSQRGQSGLLQEPDELPSAEPDEQGDTFAIERSTLEDVMATTVRKRAEGRTHCSRVKSGRRSLSR